MLVFTSIRLRLLLYKISLTFSPELVSNCLVVSNISFAVTFVVKIVAFVPISFNRIKSSMMAVIPSLHISFPNTTYAACAKSTLLPRKFMSLSVASAMFFAFAETRR